MLGMVGDLKSWSANVGLSTSLIAVSILFIVLGLLYRFATVQRASNQPKSHSHKCYTRVNYKWPFAVDLLVEASRAESGGTVLQWFHDLFKEYRVNTFEHCLLGVFGIDTRDPDCVDAVLNTKFHDFALGDRCQAFAPLLGDGIFTQDGASWKTSRDLLRPQFMQTRTKSFPVIQEEVEHLVDRVQKAVDMEPCINLQPLFFGLTFDTTLAVLCGCSTADPGPKASSDRSAFAHAFDYAQHRLLLRSRLGPFYWLINNPKFRNACNTVRTFADGAVREALQKHAQNVKAQSTERFVFLRDLIKTTQDPIVLRDQLINILLAGRDTTACLLSWAFKFLARHKEVQKQLRIEAVALASFIEGGLPTVEEIRGMKFLNHMLHESLRLYPSVPVNVRQAIKDTMLPSGGGLDGQSPIFISKGQAVSYTLYSMHRLKEIWGNDSEEFRPSRWEEERIKECRKAYTPFNAGPRVCPGQEFALLEAGYTVVRMLQTFDVIEEMEDEPKEFKHAVTLVVAPQNGCRVRLQPGKR